MNLRNYISNDCIEISKLFFDTVHHINVKDYTKPQLDVWATGEVNIKLWNELFLQHYTLVACIDDKIVGFADMDNSGYLDKLYIHKDFQRQKIATTLVNALHQNAISKGIIKFNTYVSITSVPFFENLGYSIVKENIVVKNNIELKNYLMIYELV